jgi:hypothetical protein
VGKKAKLRNFSEVKENLSYSLSKDPEERVGAVECLRRRLHRSSARLQRSLVLVLLDWRPRISQFLMR